MSLNRRLREQKDLPHQSTCICVYTYIYIYVCIWCSAARPPPTPPPPVWFPVVWVPPCPSPPVVAVGCATFHGYCWLGVRLLRVWTLGCDTVPLNSDLPWAPKPMVVISMVVMMMMMMMTRMVVMIPIHTLLRSFAQESRMKIIQIRVPAKLLFNEHTAFARTSHAKHGFQLNKAMNMQCQSPAQHKSKGTTYSHTGNSTSTSLCTTSSPSFSSVCRRGGEGEGGPVVPCVVAYPSPPRP